MSITDFVAAQNSIRGNQKAPYLLETAEPAGFGQGSAVGSTTNAVIGWQSGATTLPTTESGSSQPLFNAIFLSGSHASGAYQLNVDASGQVSITDTSTGGATSGQAMTVGGASYLLFDGGATTMIIAGGVNAEIARFYGSTFGRVPDLPGYEAWSLAVANGVVTLQQAAQGFLTSAEFTGRYGAVGTLSDGQFITDMYGNVLGRSPDQAGLVSWTNYLTGLEAQNGNTTAGNLAARSAVLQGFATSTEEIQHSASWLIDIKTGGYADPTKPIDAQTVLNQGEANNYVNTNLMSAPPSGSSLYSANAVKGPFGGVSTGWELVATGSGSASLVGNNINNATIIASATIPDVAVAGNGDTLYGGPTTGSLSIAGTSGTMVVGAGATTVGGPSLVPTTTTFPTGTNQTIIGFNPAKDVYQTVVAKGGGVNLLDASQGQIFNGANLQFDPVYGYLSKIPTPLLKLGDVGGGTAAEVAAAINKVYTLADSPAEHLIIIGQATQSSAVASPGDTVLYEYLQFGNIGFALANADLNQNHLVDANELTFEAKLVGLQTSTITAHSFGG